MIMPERRTSGSLSKLSLNFARGTNDKTEAALLQAHHYEQAGFFGKDGDAGKNRRQ